MPKYKGCYTCMKRRIKCDCTAPKCLKCQKKGLDCPGIGVRYRFNDGVASRGKLKGCAIPVPQSEVRPEPSNTANEPQVDTAPTEGLPDRVEDDEVEEVEILPFVTPRLHSVPIGLDIIDAKTRFLFSHFSEHVSPVMVLLDGNLNGYRYKVLPLAYEDPVLQRAVCVAAAFHLSSRQPELLQPAEAGRSAIITKLRETAMVGGETAVLNEATWATIVVLIIADLIMAGDDIATVFQILISFINARGNATFKSDLGEFLQEQTDLIKFFAQPVLDEQSGIERLSAEVEPHISFMSDMLRHAHPSVQLALLQYNQAYRQACDIYLLRALASTISTSLDTTDAIENLRQSLIEVDPNTPGAHTLVWPYFVAGAESKLPEHRAFFYNQLNELGLRTGYNNVLVALNTLQRIWADDHGERWTAKLPKLTKIIIM